MKYLLMILMLVILSACASKPEYRADTCFEYRFTVTEIVEVTAEYYLITVHVPLLSQSRRMKHDLFEQEVDEKGLIPKPCSEFREKEDSE